MKKVKNCDFNIFGNMTMTKKDMTMTLTPSAVWPDLNDLKIDTRKVNSLKKYLFIIYFLYWKIFFLILVSYSFSKFLSKIQFLSKIHSVPSISRPVALFLFCPILYLESYTSCSISKKLHVSAYITCLIIKLCVC